MGCGVVWYGMVRRITDMTPRADDWKNTRSAFPGSEQFCASTYSGCMGGPGASYNSGYYSVTAKPMIM